MKGWNLVDYFGDNCNSLAWQWDFQIKDKCLKQTPISNFNFDISIRWGKCNFDLCKSCYDELSK